MKHKFRQAVVELDENELDILLRLVEVKIDDAAKQKLPLVALPELRNKIASAIGAFDFQTLSPRSMSSD